MEMLGLEPTINSGSGWIQKEDGESENILCQLKSTDAQSIKVNKKDIDTLEYHASVSHKLPLFAIQFLQSNEVFLIARPEVFLEIAKYIKTGEIEKTENLINENSKQSKVNVKSIKSSREAREQFYEEKNKKYRKEKRAW